MVEFPLISLVVDAKFIHNFPTVDYVETHFVRSKCIHSTLLIIFLLFNEEDFLMQLQLTLSNSILKGNENFIEYGSVSNSGKSP